MGVSTQSLREHPSVKRVLDRIFQDFDYAVIFSNTRYEGETDSAVDYPRATVFNRQGKAVIGSILSPAAFTTGDMQDTARHVAEVLECMYDYIQGSTISF